MDKITFFDVETPNRYNDKICAIGLVHWVNGERLVSKEWLVNPECTYDAFNVRLHGISPQMTATAPAFNELWQEIAPYFESALVVAHNAAFDVGVLKKVLEAYQIELPSFKYACTVQMAKGRLPKQPFNLAALSQTLNVTLTRHHNALADTLACEGIYWHLVAMKPLLKKEIKAFGIPLIKAQTPSKTFAFQVKHHGTRGMWFGFDHIGMLTSLYAINGKSHIYIIDTYLGPDIMAAVDLELHQAFGPKPKIIINTHSDWDHIWGNCRYEDTLIIGHTLCRDKVLKEGLGQLEVNGHQKGLALGNVKIVAPNLTFEDRLVFDEDEIIVWHTPGHTEDSISIWDARDQVLVVGDNLEWPNPVLQWTNIGRYIETLEAYYAFKTQAIVSGHAPISGSEILSANLGYLRQELSNPKWG